MPNHPHLLLRSYEDDGISQFMHRLGTAFTMYFNKKHERVGALFSSRFKAVHVKTDQHFHRVINYIHANPAELYEPRWKEGIIRDEEGLQKKLLTYPFSSLPDFETGKRPETAIVNIPAVMELLDSRPSFRSLLEDARIFYRRESESLKALE